MALFVRHEATKHDARPHLEAPRFVLHRHPGVLGGWLRTIVHGVRRHWPLAAAILAGSALRFFRLGANSLWADELATLWVAGHAPGEILRLSSSANFVPPLYFLVVHGVLQVVGPHEVALRLASAIAGVCTIPVVWLLTRDITGSRSTAAMASALLAIHPLHLWFSQEARPYALGLLFGCCTLLALIRAMRTNAAGYWMAFTVFSALTFLTHTTGAVFVAVGWSWVFLSSGRRYLVRPLLASSLAIGVICAPFVFSIGDALVETGGTFHSPPRALTGLELPYTLLTYVTGYSFGPATREIQNWGALAAVRSHPLQSPIAGAVLLYALAVAWAQRRTSMRCFLALLCIPLATILGLSALTGKAYNVRYTLPALVGFVGLVSVGVRALRPLPRALALTVLLGLAAWADGQWFFAQKYWKEDSRGAVAWLDENLAPGATVAVAPSYMTQLLAYYAGRAGADIRFVAARTAAESAGREAPAALVLTRLHHVPDWKQLKAEFEGQAGVNVRERLVGYDILLGSAAETRIPGRPAGL